VPYFVGRTVPRARASDRAFDRSPTLANARERTTNVPRSRAMPFAVKRRAPPTSAATRAIERIQTFIATDGRVAALRREGLVVYRAYKRALVKNAEFRAFRKNLPPWIAKNARYKAWALDDDVACAFVFASPFVCMALTWLFFAFWRWVASRDRKETLDAVFGAAKRRKAREEAVKALPNPPPAKIERTKSGRELTMTPAETTKLEQLREKLDEAAAKDPSLLATPALRAYVDDSCLARYLRARKWKIDKALKMLVATLKWRATRKPEEITWNDVANEAATGKQYRSGRCKRNRRVLVMRPDRENTFNHEENIKFLIYTLENIFWKSSRERVPRGSDADLAPEQIVILINFTNWSRKNAVPMATARETLSILQDHYPERLGLAVCFNPPTIFRVFWSIISPFIDRKTYTKIIFVNKKKKEKAAATMSAIFHATSVDDDMGGIIPAEWNVSQYAKHMCDYDEKKAKIMANWR